MHTKEMKRLLVDLLCLDYRSYLFQEKKDIVSCLAFNFRMKNCPPYSNNTYLSNFSMFPLFKFYH